MAQNRYYSNLGHVAYVANLSGLNNVETDLQTTSSVNWPTSMPFVLSIDPGLGTEELVQVTAGAGTALSPYVMSRGFDGTPAQPHNLNAVVVPKICQLDLSEPAEHIQLSGSASGAHGLPASAWLGGQYQLIYKNVLSVTTATVTISPSYFNTIPSGCNNVVVFVNAKTTLATGGADAEQLLVQINGYTGANYGSNYIQLEGSAPSTPGTPTGQPTGGGFTATQGICGLCWTSVAGPEGVGRNMITFPFYNDTVWTKGYNFQGTATDGINTSYTTVGGGACSQVNAAVNELTFFPQNTGSSSFMAGSLFALYCY